MFRRMTRERFLSDAELEAFMRAVRERRHKNQPRDHAFFALLANTGIRPSEALALTRADVHLGAEPWINLHRVGKRHTPQPTNQIPLQAPVAGVVSRYAKGLPEAARLFAFTKRQSARLFHWYAKTANLPVFYRVYCLRHTAGMRLWRHTKDLRLMQAIMGHCQLKATRAYVHVAPSVLRSAYQAAQVGG